MWSYKIIKDYYTTEDDLNTCGMDDWELVAVRDQRHYFKKWVEPEYFFINPVMASKDSNTVESSISGNIHVSENYPTGPHRPTGWTGPHHYTGWTGPHHYTGHTSPTSPIVVPVPAQDAEPTA